MILLKAAIRARLILSVWISGPLSLPLAFLVVHLLAAGNM